MILATVSSAPVVNVYNAASSLSPAFWTMVGALSTAVIGATALLLNEWRRRKHERRLRLFDAEREACEHILTCTSNVITLHRKGDLSGANNALNDSYPAFSELQLLSSATIVNSAKDLLAASVWWFSVTLAGSTTVERDGQIVPVSGEEAASLLSEERKKALGWHDYARRAYTNSVRERFELKPFPISPGSVIRKPEGVGSVFEDEDDTV